MRYVALATDYDGTLAHHGIVEDAALAALRVLRDSGRKLILVTGRQLDDLRRVFPEHAVFDRLVVENGAVVFNPETHEELLLGEPPPEALVARLRERAIEPLSVGRVIVATWEPHQNEVFEAIHELGLEHQVIFNKGAVMVLPPGINKAAGLMSALRDLRLSYHNVIGIGDAENDHALLMACEVAVVVQNALPTLKEKADWVTRGERGAGVIELAEAMIRTDLVELEPKLGRRALHLGTDPEGQEITVHAFGKSLLLCGTSGSGKSTLATSLLEQMSSQNYQYCLLDPEGDFTNAPGALIIGDEQKSPTVDEIGAALVEGERSVVVNLLGLRADRRPQFMGPLVTRLSECRSAYGRPHWIVVDEAHHMVPEGDVVLPESVASLPAGLLLITVHPERLARTVLDKVDVLLVVGKSPSEGIHGFAHAAGIGVVPEREERDLEPGEALVWAPGGARGVIRIQTVPPKTERLRHHRKYAAGELGEDKSFYFRGPRGALNLRAHNLSLFLQMADGVDDATWTYHLGRQDYSTWVRETIKNEALADEVRAIEQDPGLDARESRRGIREAIERVYTLPA
jgi:HAD superfamily hydrolase (TIGR01484 family)